MEGANGERRPDLAARLRGTAKKLADNIQAARLTGDPLAHLLEAFEDVLSDIAALHAEQRAMHEAEKDLANRRLDIIDSRLDEIHEIHAELREVAAAAATSAKAEIGKAQADLARAAAQQVAVSAARQLKTMTRIAWLRAVSAAVAVGVVAFVTGATLGVAWGGSAAARRLATADAVVHFVAAKEGLPAVRDWNTLMRLNPIETLLAGCTGANIAVENGRKGCHLWLWIEPPAARTPNAKG
jgi:hypothetical protein